MGRRAHSLLARSKSQKGSRHLSPNADIIICTPECRCQKDIAIIPFQRIRYVIFIFIVATMHPTETDESRSQSLFLFVYLVNVLYNIHIITPILFILFRIIVSISYTNDCIHRIPFLDITSDIKRLRAQHLGFPRRYALCVIPLVAVVAFEASASSTNRIEFIGRVVVASVEPSLLLSCRSALSDNVNTIVSSIMPTSTHDDTERRRMDVEMGDSFGMPLESPAS